MVAVLPILYFGKSQNGCSFILFCVLSVHLCFAGAVESVGLPTPHSETESVESAPRSEHPQLPLQYEFRSSPASVVTHSSQPICRRIPNQPFSSRSRCHVLGRPGPSGARIWMVKCRHRNIGSGMVDPNKTWSPDSICWKPIYKWSTQPESLSADEATHRRSQLHRNDGEAGPRRPMSQPCLLPNSLGKRSHEEQDSPRPYINFAKMKKVRNSGTNCSYAGDGCFRIACIVCAACSFFCRACDFIGIVDFVLCLAELQ